MENLKSLRRHNALVIFGSFLVVLGIATIATKLLLSFQDNTLVAYGIGIVVGLIASAILALVLGKSTTITTEFLARAILHVTQTASSVPPPDVHMLPASHEFLERLAQTVYDITSSSVPIVGNRSMSSANAETFQKALLQNTPVATYVLNKEGTLTYANQVGLDYAGLKSNESIGKKFYDVVKLSFASTDTLESWLKQAETTHATDSHTWERVQLEMPDQTKKQCDMVVHFSKDNPEGVESVIVLFDRTQLYSKDDHGASFVSMAVHELRTPLTTMRGYIEIFEDEVAPSLDPEQAQFMRNLSAQAQQLAAFVSNIQNFARIEEDELSLSLKEEAWGPIVESAVKDMNLRANVRRKTLQYQIAPGLPTVGVDRSTIYEVLVNLIENAVKYTKTDSPITIRTYKKDDNWIETTVEDKGIGIPDSVIGHIFDKFYRSYRSNKTVGGTGLGLYLSKTIVSAHGGEIWVKSEEGVGSTFGFTVPTFTSVASTGASADNKEIVRGAHGWIKNHSLYRG